MEAQAGQLKRKSARKSARRDGSLHDSGLGMRPRVALEPHARIAKMHTTSATVVAATIVLLITLQGTDAGSLWLLAGPSSRFCVCAWQACLGTTAATVRQFH